MWSSSWLLTNWQSVRIRLPPPLTQEVFKNIKGLSAGFVILDNMTFLCVINFLKKI